MKHKLAVSSIIAAGLLAVLPAGAQQYKAVRLGNPATRFSKPLKTPDDLRRMLRGEKTKPDVATVLTEWGFAGSLEDLDSAAATAEISAASVPSGTRLPFMASRKRGKPRLLRDLLWAGKKPIDVFAFEFSSKCQRYRLVAPKACGNFWIEDLGRDSADEKCRDVKPLVVSVRAAADACVTQPIDVTVTAQNAPPGANVSLSFRGQQVASGPLSNGTYSTSLPGVAEVGSYDLKASVGSASGSTSVQVKPCAPTCSLMVTPAEIKKGKPFTLDASGSRPAPGVQGGIKSVNVQVLREGQQVEAFELPAPNYTRTDVVIKKKGPHKIVASVTDASGQKSSNTCEANLDVTGPSFPLFLGGYFGKERLFQDDEELFGGRCAELGGFEIGVQPLIGENTEFEVGLGVKLNFRDSHNTSMFGDVAINRLLGGAFLGGGLSVWDITESDTRDVALLLQGGFDLTDDGKWQFVGQARAPFSGFDDLDNNYQLWGGFRFRPNSEK